MSNVPIHGIAKPVVTADIELLSITAVSWGNGKLSKLAKPPELVAHWSAVQAESAPLLLYTVLGVLNVMPLHSPRLPMRVPLMGAAVPRTYRPRKSASVRLGAELTTRSVEMP